jgi:hypothetical protein
MPRGLPGAKHSGEGCERQATPRVFADRADRPGRSDFTTTVIYVVNPGRVDRETTLRLLSAILADQPRLPGVACVGHHQLLTRSGCCWVRCSWWRPLPLSLPTGLSG